MFKKISLIAVIAMFLVACQPNSQAEAQEVVNEFEEFVSSVEKKVEDKSAKSWDEIEATYNQQKKAVENTMGVWDDEMKDRWKDLDGRYENAKDDFQADANQADKKFDAWKTDVKQWMSSVENKTQTKTEQTWEEIESAFKDKKAELNEFGKDLSDEARQELNEIEARFEAARKAWKKEKARS